MGLWRFASILAVEKNLAEEYWADQEGQEEVDHHVIIL